MEVINNETDVQFLHTILQFSLANKFVYVTLKLTTSTAAASENSVLQSTFAICIISTAIEVARPSRRLVFPWGGNSRSRIKQ